MVACTERLYAWNIPINKFVNHAALLDSIKYCKLIEKKLNLILILDKHRTAKQNKKKIVKYMMEN